MSYLFELLKGKKKLVPVAAPQKDAMREFEERARGLNLAPAPVPDGYVRVSAWLTTAPTYRGVEVMTTGALDDFPSRTRGEKGKR